MGAPTYVKQMLADLKGETDDTIKVGDLNIPTFDNG